MDSTRLVVAVSGLLIVLVTLVYCGWVITSQEKRWREFVAYVTDRDNQRREAIAVSDQKLDQALAALARLEAKQ